MLADVSVDNTIAGACQALALNIKMNKFQHIYFISFIYHIYISSI